MGRTRGRQDRGSEACRGKLGRKPAGCLSVKGYSRQVRRQAMQTCEAIGFLISNRCIAAALPIAGVKHVPNAETMREHALQPTTIRYLSQRLAQQLLSNRQNWLRGWA